MPAKKKNQKSAEIKEFFRESALFVLDILYNAVIIVVLVVLIRSFLISPFRVVGSSMADTLASNEFILINKLSYQLGEPDRGDPVVFRPPITSKYSHKFEEPVITDDNGVANLDISDLETTKKVVYCQNRFLQKLPFCISRIESGDLIYFRSAAGSAGNVIATGWGQAAKSLVTTDDKRANTISILGQPNTAYLIRIYDAAGPEYFVKRVIGVPGDTVKIENGRTYLKTSIDEEFKEVDESEYLNTENLNHTYFSQRVDTNTFVVPEGQYFVMGDNRNHSNDSRSWFSPIDQQHTPFVDRDFIDGKVLIVLWPIQDLRLID